MAAMSVGGLKKGIVRMSSGAGPSAFMFLLARSVCQKGIDAAKGHQEHTHYSSIGETPF